MMLLQTHPLLMWFAHHRKVAPTLRVRLGGGGGSDTVCAWPATGPRFSLQLKVLKWKVMWETLRRAAA